jgi:LPXTG-site transpeptidase (sortase) family protein
MGYGTYFNRLDELDNKSDVYIYKDKLKLTYQFKEKMDVKETQTDILNSAKANELILITCKKSVKDERLVVKLVLKSAKTIDK